jgi:hypothetical protein
MVNFCKQEGGYEQLRHPVRQPSKDLRVLY